MTKNPNTKIPGPTIEESLEEREDEPGTMFHTNLEKRQRIPPPMSKFTQHAGIDLRKPSIPADDTKTDPKPEPNPNPLQDMQIDGNLSSQGDTKSELELKPSLDLVRFSREDLRNVVMEEVRGPSITDLRKPEVPLCDNTEIDTRPKMEPRPLLYKHRHDHSDLSNVTLKESGETTSDDSSELDLKPKPESNTVLMLGNRRGLSNCYFIRSLNMM